VWQNRKEKTHHPAQKLPSFWSRKFEISKIDVLDSDDRVMLGLMMMILLERRRG